MSWLVLAYLAVGLLFAESIYRAQRRERMPFANPFWQVYLVALMAWPICIARVVRG